MSEKVAKRQYSSAQNALGTTVTINNVTYKVTGVYKTQAQFTDDGNQNSYGVDLLLPKKFTIKEIVLKKEIRLN